MSDFLARVCAEKREEVARARRGCPRPDVFSGLPALPWPREPFAVVAEVKRASPSAGAIAPGADAPGLASVYAAAGATAVSVLTDGAHFGGSLADLVAVRAAVAVPVLRKDFVVDAYQIDEGRAAGADLVLLVAAALDPSALRDLAAHVRSLAMTPLVEVHGTGEVDAALAALEDGGILGVNSRDLHSLAVDLSTWESVAPLVPTGMPTLAESGVKTPSDAARARAAGYGGVLVGESLVRAEDPAALVRAFKAVGE